MVISGIYKTLSGRGVTSGFQHISSPCFLLLYSLPRLAGGAGGGAGAQASLPRILKALEPAMAACIHGNVP